MPNPRLQPVRAKSSPKPVDASRKTKPDASDQKWSGHCMKCKGKMEIKDAKKDQFKNGTKIIKGKCSGCGNGLSLIIPQSIWDAL